MNPMFFTPGQVFFTAPRFGHELQRYPNSIAHTSFPAILPDTAREKGLAGQSVIGGKAIA